jgi:hypothetical protein
MADDSAPLTRQQMNRFMEQIKEPFSKTEEHRRRAVEVSAGFFEKIAALSAASTAVLASLILAIANKSDIHNGPAKTLVHDLLCIAFTLGASLILAVLHNFFGALLAKAYADIIEAQFLLTIVTELIPIARETTPELTDATAVQAEEMMRGQMNPKLAKLVGWKQGLLMATTWTGRISMAAFVAAFILVMVYLSKLW